MVNQRQIIRETFESGKGWLYLWENGFSLYYAGGFENHGRLSPWMKKPR